MSNRPAPRQSKLAGQSPVAGPPATPAVDALVSQTPRPRKQKLAIYADNDIADRARAAWWKTAAQTNITTFSAWVVEAMIRQTEETEQRYNNGESFGSIEPGGIPIGRRN